MPPFKNVDCHWPYFRHTATTTSMSESSNKSVNKLNSEKVGHKNSASKESFQTLVVQVDIENDGTRKQDQERSTSTNEAVESDADIEEKKMSPSANSRRSPVPRSNGYGNHENGGEEGEEDIVSPKPQSQSEAGADDTLSEDAKAKSVSSPNLFTTAIPRTRSVASSDFHSSITTIYGSCKSSFSTSADEDERFYSVNSSMNEMNFSSTSTIDADEWEEAVETEARPRPESESPAAESPTPTIAPEENEDADRNHHHEHEDTSKLSPGSISPALSTLSLPVSTSHRRPSITLRISHSPSYGSLRRKRRTRKSKSEQIFDGEDENDYPSKVWLYKARDPSASALCPDIILHLDEDEDKQSLNDDEDDLSPVLTPEDLLTLAEQDKFPREIQVYVEYDDNDPRRPSQRNWQRSFLSFSADSPVFSSRRNESRQQRPRASNMPDEEARKESTRKMSNISRVLIVDEDNQNEDLMQVEIRALERRLSRDNLHAINLLSFLGDELSLDSGETTPVGFEYSDNVLKIRFLIAWKAAECEIKHKKTQIETEIPLAATRMYTRPISKWTRFIRIFKLRCTNCFFFIFRIRCRNSSNRYTAGDLVETESVEAFQQELEVMEYAYRQQRHSTKHEALTGETDSIRKLHELIAKGKLQQKKRHYRNLLSFR